MVDGYSVGQHPTISRLMKGVFNKRPPQPKYFYTWDVSKVTSFISLGENEALSLKLLSFKLVMLLALTRPSDLSNLDLRFLQILPKSIQFQPSELSKQSRPSRPLGLLLFPAFSVDKRLCPKETLKAYLSRTESLEAHVITRKLNSSFHMSSLTIL